VCAAMGYSEESRIPYEMAFIRNHYVGRSFLAPTQLIRDFNVRVKLNLIASLVKDKRVIIVDDSIVRGTTCKSRVKTLKDAGAAEVHVAVSCPPVPFDPLLDKSIIERRKRLTQTLGEGAALENAQFKLLQVT